MDYRTKKEKLIAMANQTASPTEAVIARKKLDEIEKKEAAQSGPPPVTPVGAMRVDQGGVVFTFDGNNWVRVAKGVGYVPPSSYTATVRYTVSSTGFSW